jgi:nitroreductase/dihydropteridine reductase
MGNSQSFLGNITWRRAVKSFAPVDGFFNVSGIEYAMVNAPSSFGLQPYTILAVRNKELKDKLKDVSFNQPQVTECNILYILCAHTDVDVRAEEFLKRTGAESIRGMLTGFLASLPDKTAWAVKQAYIALGFGLAAAAELRVASCPMEGFMPSEVAKILELPATLVPCVYLAVGKEPADGGAPFPRFRFPAADLLKRYD